MGVRGLDDVTTGMFTLYNMEFDALMLVGGAYNDDCILLMVMVATRVAVVVAVVPIRMAGVTGYLL